VLLSVEHKQHTLSCLLNTCQRDMHGTRSCHESFLQIREHMEYIQLKSQPLVRKVVRGVRFN
jgi:hypothetical protein